MAAKSIVVTGGFGVLGAAVAAEALAQGWKVAVVDYAADAPSGLSGATLIGGVDLTDPGQAKAAMDKAATALGGIDALANIAGGFRWETIGDGDAATWDLLYRMNVSTTLNATKGALDHLGKSNGRIVNVGANGAVKAGMGMGAYAASKAGVHRLTEALAEELKGKVAVNAVLPSIIDTPTNRADMPDADPSAWVTPKALADVILFLASDRAGPVTGALLPVTGGV